MKTKNIYADPTIDFAFKRIFGTERFKAATIGPLNSIIKDVNIVDDAVDEASGHRLPASPEYHFFDLNAFK